MGLREQWNALLDIVQQDVGNRGLSTGNDQSLFQYCQSDFADACQSILSHTKPRILIVTGFYIPYGSPPAYETDGPLGAILLAQSFVNLGIRCGISSEPECLTAIQHGLDSIQSSQISLHGLAENCVESIDYTLGKPTHIIFIERVGPNAANRCLTMRGKDVTSHIWPTAMVFDWHGVVTVGIGDGGNEIGMGKIPHPLIASNIRLGQEIHCQVPTDFLIVAGVSNWGAYALAAALLLASQVHIERFVRLIADQETLLTSLANSQLLIDGVTGLPTPTVDGLPWDMHLSVLNDMANLFAKQIS